MREREREAGRVKERGGMRGKRHTERVRGREKETHGE